MYSYGFTQSSISERRGVGMIVCADQDLRLMVLNIFRDLYTSYGETFVVHLRIILMVHRKIGSIGFAATAVSSKQVSVPHHYSLR